MQNESAAHSKAEEVNEIVQEKCGQWSWPHLPHSAQAYSVNT